MDKKRWLYYLGEAITILVPLAVVIEAAIRIGPNRKVAVQLAGVVLGCVYLAFLAKRVRRAIAKLRDGALKTFVGGMADLIPFGTVGLLVYLAEHIFANFDGYILMVIVAMFIGTVMKTIENAMNKDYLHDIYIAKLAGEQAEIETKKQELLDDTKKVA